MKGEKDHEVTLKRVKVHSANPHSSAVSEYRGTRVPKSEKPTQKPKQQPDKKRKEKRAKKHKGKQAPTQHNNKTRKEQDSKKQPTKVQQRRAQPTGT
jgi:hypothetical protein